MVDFTPLSIYDGVGKVHINRFRICVRPSASGLREGQIGRALPGRMPHYMDPRTAAVVTDGREWQGSPTLKFRGVAVFRPFDLPITIPGPHRIKIPVPEKVRNWMIPDVHTDQVGFADKGGTGFTVQTLRRHYEDENDAAIRRAVLLGVVPLIPLSPPLAILAKVLGDIAVSFNQFHFLAGRRSFRFGPGSAFGYDDGRYVFETAAIERFSHRVFEAAQIAVGPLPQVIRKVWVQMVENFCVRNGYVPLLNERAPRGTGWTPGSAVVWCMQTEVENVEAILGHPHWAGLNQVHTSILEPP